VTAVARLPPGARDAVLARIPPRLVEGLDRAGIMAWMPFEVNLCATHAVYEALPPEEVERFFRGLLTTVYGTALFYPFVRQALRTYVAGDPARSARWIPGGMGLLFRGLGTWKAEALTPRRSRIAAEDLPEEVDAVWLDSLRHGFASLFDQVDREGVVVLESYDLEAGTAVYIMEW